MKRNRTEVFETSKPAAVLWVVPTYISLPDISNDGRHLAALYRGSNILRDPIASSDPLITFYNISGTKRVVTVGELIPDIHALPRSTSGRPWGYALGFQDGAQYTVVLYNKKSLTLDPEPTPH